MSLMNNREVPESHLFFIINYYQLDEGKQEGMEATEECEGKMWWVQLLNNGEWEPTMVQNSLRIH